MRRPRGPSRRALWLITAGVGALLLGLSLARFHSVHQRTFDLALYARMAWGFAHGDGWSPIVGAPSLGVHVSLVMGPLAALGALFGHVQTLLAAQALAFAACVWPLARLAERRLGPGGGWLGVGAWVLYPNLVHVASYEFHPSNLAVWPLCWAADALDRRDPRALLGWGGAALACREDMGLVVALYGLSLCLTSRSRRGLGTALLGAGGLLLGATIVQASQGSSAASLDLHFGAWGGSPLGILAALWTEPARALSHLLAPATLAYLPLVLAPLLGLPLRAPWLLLPALAPLALNVVSTFPTTTELYSHYLTPAVPALVSAGIVGLARTRLHVPAVGRSLWWSALVLAFLFAGGSPVSRSFEPNDFVDDARSHAARRVLAQIDDTRSVQAPDPLLPHLAERQDVRRGPPPESGAHWVVLDLSHRQRYAHTETLLRTSEEPLTRRWLARADHTPVVHAPPFVLLERRPFDRRSKALAPFFAGAAHHAPSADQARRLCDCLSLLHATRRERELVLTLRAHDACPPDLAVRLGSAPSPDRVDLLFDGVLSPAQLRAGDVLRSGHRFAPASLGALERHGLHVGALRASGAPPTPDDPKSVHVPVRR